MLQAKFTLFHAFTFFRRCFAMPSSENSPSSTEQLLKADKHSPCDPCEMYVDTLVKTVQERLLIRLKGKPAVGGINLTGTLQQQEPLTIDGSGTLQTTKEHWRWENCRLSLETKGLYEAPGSIFCLSTEPAKWGDKVIASNELTYGQVAAGRLMWSDEKFARSSDDVSKRRFLINGAIPSAVATMADVPTSKVVGFEDLPLSCSTNSASASPWPS